MADLGKLAVAGLGVLSLLAMASIPTSAKAAVTGDLPSSTWAGYYAQPPAGEPVQGVQVTFTLPKVSCSKGWGAYPRTAALWVGIGGEAQVNPGASLEQDGVWVVCMKPSSPAVYYPFWEIAPDNSDPKHNGINFYTDPRTKKTVLAHAGDTIQLLVAAPGSVPGDTTPEQENDWAFSVAVGDSPFGQYTEYYPLPAKDTLGTTAEVITEWTKFKVNGKAVGGLADVGRVKYVGAEYDDGTAANQAWQGLALNTITMHEYEPTPRHPFRYVNVIVPGPASLTPSGVPGNNTFSTYYTGSWPTHE